MYKNNAYCVGGGHFSGTANIYIYIYIYSSAKNTTRRKRNKSINVSDAVIRAEELKGFFEDVGKAAVSLGAEVANDAVRALEIAISIKCYKKWWGITSNYKNIIDIFIFTKTLTLDLTIYYH